jgi:hypothetical protein
MMDRGYINLSRAEKALVDNPNLGDEYGNPFWFWKNKGKVYDFSDTGIDHFFKEKYQNILDKELEVTIPTQFLHIGKLMGKNLPMWVTHKLLKDNPNKMVPLGYALSFNISKGIPYSLPYWNSPEKVDSVESIKVYFGLPQGITLKNLKLDNSYSYKILSFNRSSKVGKFYDRGGMGFALKYRADLTKLSKPKPTQKTKETIVSKLDVPLRMKATPRKGKASKKYAIPKDKAYPIGDLYHARKAINYLTWQWRKDGPGNSYIPESKKVFKAVERAYGKYNWKKYWDYKRKKRAELLKKNKKSKKLPLPTYNRIMK